MLRQKNFLASRTRFLLLAVFVATQIAIGAGCQSKKRDSGTSKDAKGGISTAKLEAASAPIAGSFTQIPNESAGLDFGNELRPENMKKYLLNGAGIATGDYDADGWIDIYAVSQDGENKLFRQTAAWKFEDVTESAGGLAGGDRKGTGAAFADVNGDGHLDLYVCNIDGPNLLFINQGDGTFKEEAKSRGVEFDGATTMVSFADYDRDGDVDIYLVNNRVLSIVEENPQILLRQMEEGMTVHPDFQEQYFLLEGRVQEAGQRDRLYRNDGKGNFADVTEDSGIAGFDMGLSATWWDFDNDGWLDLYVANDLKSPDHLYRNLGNGKFQDVIAETVGHTPWFSMGADAADINNDGMDDFLVADMSSTTHYKQKTTMGEMGNSAWFLTTGRPRQFMRNALYVNSGSSRMFEAANLTGLDSTDWSWSIKFGDFDSDALIDVFVTNGVGHNMNDSDKSEEYKRLVTEGKQDEALQMMLTMEPLNEANLAFRNLGDLKFDNVAAKWKIDHLGVSQGASVADIDNDGDLDLLVSNMNEPLGIYRNDISNGNNLIVQLRGSDSNSFGLGAKVTVDLGDQKLVRTMNSARGFMSADHPALHFGLGDRDKVHSIQVEWPSGLVQRFADIGANQRVTISEGSEGTVKPEKDGTSPAWFASVSDSGPRHRHRELEFDDYAIQPLLPNKLSQLGSGLAWADVNGDSIQDCFCGNAGSGTGQILLGQSSGSMQPGQVFRDERSLEDMGAVFLDSDGDGDQDLYVVSGGYEREAGSERYADRLYLNDGSGNFSLAPAGTIPEARVPGSSVSAGDFDRDGDLDLFVGTRLIPARWPLATSSRLLENRDGTFVDVTADVAPHLQDIGLVTGSVWTDVDQDGWVDLLVTLEWGPVTLLGNQQGKLVDRTDQSGLSAEKGWWNSISPGDIDNDGDIDFVAMNFGLNTKYHADDKHPVVLFAADMDDNGTLDVIEAEYEGDVCYPVRGKSCSSHAMPFLKEKFTTFHDFALADISTVYSDESLDNSARFSANQLRSVVLINNGQGKFESRALPRLAQISPGFGTTLTDLDGDGNLDLCIAQNFMNPQPETGQMDGGLGMILRGNGKGDFDPMRPDESGILVAGQGMALTVVDLNADAAPDLVMSVNDSDARTWLNKTTGTRSRHTIRLRSGGANKDAIGATVVLKYQSGLQQSHVMAAGTGYLSQSPAMIFASSSQDDPLTEAMIRWPDGSQETRLLDISSRDIVIEQ